MKFPTPRRPRTRILALVTLLVTTLFATTALAYGRVQWKSTRLKEDVAGTQSSWKIELTFYLDKSPDMAMVPVRFEFLPTVYYERFQDDSSPNIQTRKVPLSGQQPIIESVDLGFMDPGTGKIENRTRFAFRITRAHGFQGGEYRVTIKDSRRGATIGQPTTLILEGENEVIDRRAMVFAGKDEKAEKDEAKKEEAEAAAAVSDDPLEPGAESMDWSEVEREEEPLPPPESLRKRQGSCGCRAVGGADARGYALPALLGLGLLLSRRRRRAA